MANSIEFVLLAGKPMEKRKGSQGSDVSGLGHRKVCLIGHVGSTKLETEKRSCHFSHLSKET